MIVKVGDKYYNSNKEPIMIILSEQDKKNIASMIGHKETKYCSYPDKGYMEKDIENFMETE
jgi:hypothetical protein